MQAVKYSASRWRYPAWAICLVHRHRGQPREYAPAHPAQLACAEVGVRETIHDIRNRSETAAFAIPNFIAFRNKATCAPVEMEANQALAALTDFFADPKNTHVPSFDELVSATGFEADNRITVYLEGNADKFRITAVHNTASCPNGESYVLSIADEAAGRWQ